MPSGGKGLRKWEGIYTVRVVVSSKNRVLNCEGKRLDWGKGYIMSCKGE